LPNRGLRGITRKVKNAVSNGREGKALKTREGKKAILVSVSKHHRNKAITLLSVKGLIDAANAPLFEKKFLSVLGERKFKLVIDLKNVNFICNSGWGILIREIRRIRNHKGDMVLVGMNSEVSEIFDLLDFTSILKSFPDIESAVQKGFSRSR
jgi:anti-sigma B factor antagonist